MIIHFYHTLFPYNALYTLLAFQIIRCEDDGQIFHYFNQAKSNVLHINRVHLSPTHGRSVRFALCIHAVICCYYIISVCEILLQH